MTALELWKALLLTEGNDASNYEVFIDHQRRTITNALLGASHPAPSCSIRAVEYDHARRQLWIHTECA